MLVDLGEAVDELDVDTVPLDDCPSGDDVRVIGLSNAGLNPLLIVLFFFFFFVPLTVAA